MIAPTLNIDYWDYLGWQDTLARQEHGERQRAYARAMKRRTLYTPQMLVQGRQVLKGGDMEALNRHIKEHQARPTQVELRLRRDGGAASSCSGPLVRQLVQRTYMW